VSATSPEFFASIIFFEILNLYCFYSRCIWENRDQIRTKLHTGNSVQNTYNYSLEGRRYADIVEQVHSDIMTHERTRFKINYSYGVILRNVETDQLRCFYGSLGNARMLDFAVLISDQDDLRSFLENICDFDMREKIERPDTKWVLVTIINIIFFVSLLPDISIGGGVKLPAFIANNKGLHALVKRHSRVYDDNLCLFRCLAVFHGEPLEGCERAAKDKFYQYCHERELNPNKFSGVTLREFVDVEDIFEINVMVYALELDDRSPKATVVQLSRKKYERTMYVNLHESHFSYIFDVSKYCQRYECPRCSEFWTSEHFHRHVRTCNAQVKHTYVGGVYNNKKLYSINWSSLELMYRMKIVSTRIVAHLTMKVILTRAIFLTLVRNRFGSRAMYLALFLFVLMCPTLNNRNVL